MNELTVPKPTVSNKETSSIRVLWVATKSPYPPHDGGRLLLWETFGALAESHVWITLVAPAPPGDAEEAKRKLRERCVPRLVWARPGSRLGTAFRTLWGAEPWSLVRHRWPALRAEVERVIAEELPDVVVAEQLQSLRAAEPASEKGLPLVLRAQNVESSLWRQAAARIRGVPPALLVREAKRLEAAEREALRAVSWVVTLSVEDQAEFALLSRGARHVAVIPPPFPERLPPGPPLEGSPPCVLFGSSGWLPNRLAEEELERAVWPAIQRACPGAVLYRFTRGSAASTPSPKDGSQVDLVFRTSLESEGPGVPGGFPGVVPPRDDGREPRWKDGYLADSRWAFPENGVLLLPISVASGVRMRILEAWARGVAVVGTPEAVRGLGVRDGQGVLLARSPEEFGAAVARLVKVERLRSTLLEQGRQVLRERHNPKRVAQAWRSLFSSLRQSRS